MADKGARGPVGLIGIGNMGLPMCRNLAAGGWAVRAFDVREAAAESAAQAHANIAVAKSLSDLADCPITITMVPDSKAVAMVVRGDSPDDFAANGLAAHLEPGTVIVDMSSSFPPETRKLGQALKARQIGLVDAPVSGGVAKAVTAQLAIMVGGESEDVDGVSDMLATMGRIFRTGGPGSGHATKALNNYLSASSVIATAEALVIGDKFGLDPAVMTEVFNNSTGRSNATENKALQFFLSGAYNSGFALALLDKDVGMARDMARALGIDAKGLEMASGYLAEVRADLGEAADHTEVHRWVSKVANDA